MTDPNGEFRFDFQNSQHPEHTADRSANHQTRQQVQPTQPPQPVQPVQPTQSSDFGATQAFPAAGQDYDALGATQAMPPVWEGMSTEALPSQNMPTEAMPQSAMPTQAMPQQTAFQQPVSQQPTEMFGTTPMPRSAVSSQQPHMAQSTEAFQPMQPMQPAQPTMIVQPGDQATQAFDFQSLQDTQAFTPGELQQPRVAGQTAQATQAMPATQPRTISTPTQPTILPPTIPPDDEDGNDGGDGKDSDGRKPINGKVVGIAIAVIVVIALIVGGVIFFRSNSGKIAYAACTKAQSSYNDAIKDLNTEATQAKQNTPSADAVDNQSTLDNLNKAISGAQSISTNASCSADMKTQELKTNTSSFKDATKDAKDAKKSIEQALDAATSSKDAKNTSALKSDLNANISTAQTVLNDSAGRVADESTRTALQDAISNANNVAGQSSPSQSDVSNAKSRLQKAVSDVNASISAKQQADAEAQRQQQEQQEAEKRAQEQNQNQSNSGQGDSGQTDQCDSTDASCQTSDTGN